MEVRLVLEFRFESAHLLPKVPPGHKCQRLHGHSFKVEIACKGPVNPETGWFTATPPAIGVPRRTSRPTTPAATSAPKNT